MFFLHCLWPIYDMCALSINTSTRQLLIFDLCRLQIQQKGGQRLLSSQNRSLTMSPGTTRTSHAVRHSLSSVSQANRQKRWTGNKKGWMQIIPELFSQARCPSSWSTPPSPASLNTFVPSSAKSQLSRWDLCNLKIWKIFVTSWVPDQDTKVKWRRL